MDKPKSKDQWSWLPAVMPGVARLVADKRAKHGRAWVSECWRRGIDEGEPGWFFAWEGPVAIGTPWDVQALVQLAEASGKPRAAMLFMRTEGAPNGKD